jgi:MFS family permease
MTDAFRNRYGRRVPILIGAVIVIGSAFMQTFTKGSNQFIGGRIIMGFGAGIQSISG